MTNTTFSRSHVRFFRAAIFCAVALSLVAPSAQAQGRRARLSADLAEKVQRGTADSTPVIVRGSATRIQALAARHGLRVSKFLATGAVLDVPAGFLQELAEDN